MTTECDTDRADLECTVDIKSNDSSDENDDGDLEDAEK
jgi:hypothetical protein